MAVDDTIRLVFEGIVAAGVVGSAMSTFLKLGRLGERIEIHGKAIEKMADVLTVQALQKAEIAAIRERQIQDSKRTDETFSRIFNRLDRVAAEK